MEQKKWYTSKTLWANLVSVAGVFTAQFFGFEIGAEKAMAILGVINMVLRFVTKSEIVW